jgi:hypothetical protein
MKAGIVVTLRLLVPCDPKNVDSMAGAAAKAKTLSSLDGLRTLAADVELLDTSMSVSSGRDRKAAK